MNKTNHSTTDFLFLSQSGEETARQNLFEYCFERIRILARKMLRHQFPQVGRWEGTDDLNNRCLIRLHKTLDKVKLESGRHFYNLVGQIIRRELIDLARHYYGKDGIGENHDSDFVCHSEGIIDNSGEPTSLFEWTEFHLHIEDLPENEREVVNLLWYQALTQAEIAKALGVNERTIRRRWVSAKAKLFEAMQGESPNRFLD